MITIMTMVMVMMGSGILKAIGTSPLPPYLSEKEAKGGRGSQCPPQISKSPIEKFKRMNKPSKKLQEEVYTCSQVALQQLNLANNRIRHLSDKVTITTS